MANASLAFVGGQPNYIIQDSQFYNYGTITVGKQITNTVKDFSITFGGSLSQFTNYSGSVFNVATTLAINQRSIFTLTGFGNFNVLTGANLSVEYGNKLSTQVDFLMNGTATVTGGSIDITGNSNTGGTYNLNSVQGVNGRLNFLPTPGVMADQALNGATITGAGFATYEGGA